MIYSFFFNSFTSILLAICILGSSIAYLPYSSELYILAILIFFLYLFSNAKEQNNSFRYYLFLFFSFSLTNIFNLSFDKRFFYFAFMILVCSSLFSSAKNFNFKIKFLNIFFQLSIALTIVNLVCYFIGINMYQLLAIETANVNDFSGIMIHPMWLSALSGISTVVSFYFFLSSSKLNLKVLYLGLAFSSVFVTIISASRISLASSLLAMLLLLFSFESRIKYIIRYIIIIVVLIIFSYPILNSYSTRLQGKIEHQKESRSNTRQSLWNARIIEFEDSPILGVGFATQLNNGRSITGRMESGSGWLSILSQTGLLGLFSVLLILNKSKLKFKILRQNKSLYIYYGVLFFLSVHSFAEGYILTSGYYLCFIFWLILDVLIQFNSYNKFIIKS